MLARHRPSTSLRSFVLGFALAFAALCAFGAVRAHADEPHEAPAKDDYPEELQGFVPGASRLEGRLMAPCCWTQTIDIHDSEISLAMRHEIRKRLRAGEAPDTIEASFVERYGPRILAVQPNSQLKSVAVGLSLLMGAAGVAAVLMVGRWRKRRALTASPAAAGAGAAGRDQWDDRLDAELKGLDEP